MPCSIQAQTLSRINVKNKNVLQHIGRTDKSVWVKFAIAPPLSSGNGFIPDYPVFMRRS
jgi:hypothetical protein